jgi:uncharacterized membrane protein YfbV (UPF0208 family)
MNYASILNPSMVRPLVFGWKLSLKAVCLAGFSLILSLAGLFIFQVSSITQSSFAIAGLEKEIAGMDKEFKNLQASFADTSALSGLEEVLASKGYEKVGKIHYIQVLENTVAAK